MTPIRARTEGECKAYVDGWLNCLLMAQEQGLEAAREEGLMMAQFEWPERFDEQGKLKEQL